MMVRVAFSVSGPAVTPTTKFFWIRLLTFQTSALTMKLFPSLIIPMEFPITTTINPLSSSSSNGNREVVVVIIIMVVVGVVMVMEVREGRLRNRRMIIIMMRIIMTISSRRDSFRHVIFVGRRDMLRGVTVLMLIRIRNDITNIGIINFIKW